VLWRFTYRETILIILCSSGLLLLSCLVFRHDPAHTTDLRSTDLYCLCHVLIKQTSLPCTSSCRSPACLHCIDEQHSTALSKLRSNNGKYDCK
jgi:hypothetical protein